VVRRWRRARRYERRARLAQDAHRTVGMLAAVLADAERASAEVPDGVGACLAVWSAWSTRLGEWARGGDSE
jgi:hypothetical protein